MFKNNNISKLFLRLTENDFSFFLFFKALFGNLENRHGNNIHCF